MPHSTTRMWFRWVLVFSLSIAIAAVNMPPVSASDLASGNLASGNLGHWHSKPVHWLSGSSAARLPEPPALALSIDDHVPAATVVESGQLITYTLSVTNLGGSPTAGITITVATPRYTGVTSDTLAHWDCRTDVGLTPLCVQQLQPLSPTASSQAVFQVMLASDLPEDVDSVVMEASVVAENVVCGECGYASLETPVKAVNGLGDGLRLYLPVVTAPLQP